MTLSYAASYIQYVLYRLCSIIGETFKENTCCQHMQKRWLAWTKTHDVLFPCMTLPRSVTPYDASLIAPRFVASRFLACITSMYRLTLCIW